MYVWLCERPGGRGNTTGSSLLRWLKLHRSRSTARSGSSARLERGGDARRCASGRAAAASPATAIATASETGNTTRRSTAAFRMPERRGRHKRRHSVGAAEHEAEERGRHSPARTRAARAGTPAPARGTVDVQRCREMLAIAMPRRASAGDRQSRARLVEADRTRRRCGMDACRSLASRGPRVTALRAPRRRSSRSRAPGPAARAPDRPQPAPLTRSGGGWPCRVSSCAVVGRRPTVRAVDALVGMIVGSLVEPRDRALGTRNFAFVGRASATARILARPGGRRSCSASLDGSSGDPLVGAIAPLGDRQSSTRAHEARGRAFAAVRGARRDVALGASTARP